MKLTDSMNRLIEGTDSCKELQSCSRISTIVISAVSETNSIVGLTKKNNGKDSSFHGGHSLPSNSPHT